LQRAKVLDSLLARVMDARARMSREAGTTPVLIKIAPDLTLAELDDIVGAVRRHRVDGMIVGNTTVARPQGLRDLATAREAGGRGGGGGGGGAPFVGAGDRGGGETFGGGGGRFPV